MPRPKGATILQPYNVDMDEKIAAVGARNRRPGHDTTVRTRRIKPAKERSKKGRSAEASTPAYPGWKPTRKQCRRPGCGNVYLPSAPAQAYCSPDCRAEAERGQRRITDKAQRARAKARKQGEQGSEREKRVCRLAGCDVEFIPDQPRTAYCSPEHKAQASNKFKREARHRAEGKAPPIVKLPAPGPDTMEAIAEIERLEKLVSDKLEALPELQREYLVLLWQRVSRDPACPQHVYDRLERILGLPAAEGATMPAVDAS